VDQAGRFARDPELILQLAHFLASEHRRQTGRDVEVCALVLTSLNGRKPELFLDPSVNLAGEPRGFYHRPGVQPQNELLRDEPWSVPLLEWERHVELPPLPIVHSSPSTAGAVANRSSLP
jgi:vitamin K-dependent gamma-carboxylase